jgi:hypothetical protein
MGSPLALRRVRMRFDPVPGADFPLIFQVVSSEFAA